MTHFAEFGPSAFGLARGPFSCLLEGDRLASLEDLARNPVLDPLHHPEPPVTLIYHGCPVCKKIHGSRDKAEHCADGERSFYDRFKGLKAGDRLECVSSASGELVTLTVLGFSPCWSGFSCGEILTIHARNERWDIYLNANNCQEWKAIRPL
jgi:hypothetical protein